MQNRFARRLTFAYRHRLGAGAAPALTVSYQWPQAGPELIEQQLINDP